MSPVTSLIFALSLVAGVFATPYQRLAEKPSQPVQLQSRQSGRVVTTGPRNGDSAEVFPRKNVLDLESGGNPYEWTAFVLGMQGMMAASEETDEPMSYFQISAIHGRPMEPWDNVIGDNDQLRGVYCPHSSTVFLPWHRLYLSLFEQALVDKAVEAANEFPSGRERNAMLAAARSMRLPYWDWADTSRGFIYPSLFGQEEVTVQFPNGTSESVPNPLKTYRFQNSRRDDFEYAPYNAWDKTLRIPTSARPDAESQDELMPQSFPDVTVNTLRSSLYRLLSQPTTFFDFSQTFPSTPNASFFSLEDIHDDIHVGVGGAGRRVSGHMSRLDFAAFDPLFWLHHANVDRIFAIWQTLYEDVEMLPNQQESDTYWYSSGDTLDVNSQLLPFRNPSGGYWTSRQVWDPTALGFSYPELMDFTSKEELRTRINRLYGPSQVGREDRASRASRDNRLARRQGSKDHMRFVAPDAPRDWVLQTVGTVHALGPSYCTFAFLGDYDKDAPDGWTTSDNFVGMSCVLSGGHEGHKDPPSSGAILLTEALTQADKADPDLDLSDVDAVSKYLEQNLHYIVRTVDGDVHDPSTVPNYKATVKSSDIKFPVSLADFPLYGKIVNHKIEIETNVDVDIDVQTKKLQY